MRQAQVPDVQHDLALVVSGVQTQDQSGGWFRERQQATAPARVRPHRPGGEVVSWGQRQEEEEVVCRLTCSWAEHDCTRFT